MNKVARFEGGDAFNIARVVWVTVFSQPSVQDNQVPSSVESKWERKQWSLAKWVTEFQAVSNANDVMASNANIKNVVILPAEAVKFRTSLKKRKSDRGEDLPKPLNSVAIATNQVTLPERGTEALETLLTQAS